jgi:NAD+ kinase
MADVLFVAKSKLGPVGDLLDQLIATTEQSGRRAIQDETELAEVEMVVSLGGDGTFLRAGAIAHQLDIPIMGVDFGRIGYLLNLAPSDASTSLSNCLEGRAAWEPRTVLDIAIDGEHYSALNELALEREFPGHMVLVGVTINDAAWMQYSADGVLIATAMGSTGYSLSAGGPVLPPDSPLMVINPVAPHLQINNALLVAADGEILMENQGPRGVAVVIDGHSVARLDLGQQVTTRTHPRPLRVFASDTRSYVTRLREVLSEERRGAD